MTNRQAVGYVLLAIKQLGYSSEQAELLFEEMFRQFDLKTESEAQEQGFDWYYNLKDN